MTDQKKDLTFTTMPSEGKNFSPTSSDSETNDKSSLPPTSSGGSRKGLYIVIAVVVVLGLGALAYYMLGVGKKEETNNQQQTTSRLPRAWLNQYFNSDTCADQATCGDEADPETDGLKNYDEFVAGTNPLNPDTDDDGLADGDEVNIFKTEPKDKYTDTRPDVEQNNWTDGSQIKNGFDPLTPAKKFTDSRKQQIASDTETFKLHEPTLTTLGQNSTSIKTYSNAEYKFEFSYPSTWKQVSELKASLSDYLSNNGNRLFIAIYPAAYPASDFDARIDVYSANLTSVKQNHTILQNKTSTNVVVNGNTWEKIGDLDYVIYKGTMTYHVSGETNIVSEILSGFKFTQ